MHIFELFCLLFAFLTDWAVIDTCKGKALGHLSLSLLPAQSASEETMTQKTNGPDSNNDDFTTVDFSIRFLKLSQNVGTALRHNYQRQIMNSETQFRTTLTNVYYRQAPGKVMEVERIKERKKMEVL